jgi:formamidopyrimidine-DNA glycosylase
MAELPEVETIVKGLQKTIVGKKIRDVRVIFAGIVKQDSKNFKKTVGEGKIIGVRRRGKFILIDLSNGETILVHLGMTGSFLLLRPSTPLNKHDHLILKFYKTNKELRYNDQRKFGRIKSCSTSKEENISDLKKLGPEPLNISSSDFLNLFKKSKVRIKSALLNQQIIAGLGNIYADEALFQAKIHPEERPITLSNAKLEKLRKAIKKILMRAIKAGGSTIINYSNLFGEQGKYQNYHKVYGKEGMPCPICGTPIEKLTIAQRSTFYCAKCQKKK